MSEQLAVCAEFEHWVTPDIGYFATNILSMSGAPLTEISKIFGRKAARVVNHYCHFPFSQAKLLVERTAHEVSR
jgi:hypothetical protein